MRLKNLSAKIKIPNFLNKKLKIKKINQIYKRFENTLNINDNYIVAVSGGPDSMALAYLSKIYSLKKKLISKFFVIDHKLRPNSSKEAQLVKKVLKKNFINAEILKIHGKKPLKGIQSFARDKRYKLLFKQCDKYSIKNILLGHHSGDLIENFFIRLTRGSGLKGLISLEKTSTIGTKNLIRPLFNQKKEDLIFISRKVFDFYIDDPSNEDEKFLRIKIRKFIKELNKNGLDEQKLLLTLKNLRLSDNVINFYVKKNFEKNTFFIKKDNKLILNLDFFRQPHEIIFRSLSEAVKLVGKKYYFARGRKLDNVINDFFYKKFFKITLGGCIIEKFNQTLVITKER